ncbi:MAG: hypothetical protein O7149_02565, partial [Wolbachia endosymbiont of Hylaeus sinuatus]|nr:hypothetical protein [Wolbachia endosymbiont of Hylaeus sinuatus]
FRKILVALHKSLILVLTTSILLSVNSCLSDQILSFTDYEHSPLTSKNNILFNMITSMLTKLAA